METSHGRIHEPRVYPICLPNPLNQPRKPAYPCTEGYGWYLLAKVQGPATVKK